MAEPLSITVKYIGGKSKTPPELTLTETRNATRKVDKVVVKPSENLVRDNTLDVFLYADANRGPTETTETVKHKPNYQQVGKQQFSIDGISEFGLDISLNGDITVEINDIRTQKGKISISEGAEGKQSVTLRESKTPKLSVALGSGNDRFIMDNRTVQPVEGHGATVFNSPKVEMDYKINMGDGDDYVSIESLNFNGSGKYTKPVIDGGTGNDLLYFFRRISRGLARVPAPQMIIKNFETINIEPG